MLGTLARCASPVWSRWTRPPADADGIRRAQERALRRLLARHADLPAGLRWGYRRLLAERDVVAAFRAAVPATEYEDWRGLIERTADGEPDALVRGRAVALAQTSGTTRGAAAGERWIPQDRALLRHHRRGGSTALARLVAAGRADAFDGRMLMLGGSTLLDHAHAVPSGDLSGICAARLPRWARSRAEPGPDIAAVGDWPRRLELIAERCADRDVRFASGIPSWLLVLFHAVCRRAGVARAREAWPRLRALVHGGHAIEPFIAPLAEHLPPETAMVEVYPASECFIAVGERAWRLGDGVPADLELLTDHGAFLEFAPQADRSGGGAVGAHELEAGGVYRVLVTTPGGLARYQIGDLVLARGPGRIRFAGRARARISVFGEHVEGFHLADAVSHAAVATSSIVAQYHVAPILPSADEPRGRHEWLVEFARAPVALDAFAAALDARLRERVLDYAAHRVGDQQLLAPAVRAMPSGAFAAWLARGARLDAQRKVPQAWPDRTIADAVLAASAADGGIAC